MRFDRKQLLLYGVTDRSWLNGQTLYEQVRQALEGGVSFLQLREKNLSEQAFLEEAKEIQKPVTQPFLSMMNTEMSFLVTLQQISFQLTAGRLFKLLVQS